ncbi:MAG: ASCH domain-containing protein [Rickettsiales bacterium]|jgi:hypothetical protein|nr:ASCH domain-containing protein [Rickettsiales bacterium]
MKALTLWQPYASAIAIGLKQYETRSWATKHRGLIAIHCSVKPLSGQYKELAEKYGIADKLQYGKIVVICDLTACILMTEEFIKEQSQTEIDFGDWRKGRYAWKLQVVKVLEEPITAKGYQGLWNTDLFPDLEKAPQSPQMNMNF